MPKNGNQNGEVSGEVVQDTRARVARITALMAREATMADEETEFLGDDILAIFEAETEDEMWEADNRTPLNAKTLEGCEVTVTAVNVKWSRRNDIKTMFRHTDERTGEVRNMYLWVEGYRTRKTGAEDKRVVLPEIGEVFHFDTSARFVVAKLLWLYVHGEINPDMGASRNLRFDATDLGGGEKVVKLSKVEPSAVRATAE